MIPPIQCWFGHAFDSYPDRVGDVVRCVRCGNRYRAVYDGFSGYYVRERGVRSKPAGTSGRKAGIDRGGDGG